MVCPICETRGMKYLKSNLAFCPSCGRTTTGAVLEALLWVVGLPDAVGDLTCWCGHPEVRLMLDGTFRCPACASEISPAEDDPDAGEVRGGAYWSGWLDGCSGRNGNMARNERFARCKDPLDRLDYYRGHRAGREARRMGTVWHAGAVENGKVGADWDEHDARPGGDPTGEPTGEGRRRYGGSIRG
ncbi:MAG: hypothetical protein AVDCRST_MAG12-1134 [uncultured Rubrobacteraceae bacterium]|uniref:Uncharacterized protein n=1 Tax=uncultured Rubrobacteraceae bacterium TaxID=349277 RepID=A0A6J4RK68_9ACTN|nr:MAG: hypothetical protein AVDCRST_MAG12-1134 [uncultured Rubrobacteraceae bacterium]